MLDSVTKRAPARTHKLRPYQADLVASIKDAFKTERSVLMQLPTGGGKTIIAAEYIRLMRRQQKRVWIVCHRREIIRQTSRALDAAGIPHGRVVAGQPACDSWQVLVCSVGTLHKRFKKLAPPDVVIWDECHHVPARSWASIKDALGSAIHLGLTATPCRLDGAPLGDWFDRLICGPNTRELIDGRFLNEFRIFAPSTPDLSGVKVQCGDYQKGQLGEVMSRPRLVGDVVDHYKRIVHGSRAVAFCASIKSSKAVVARFNRAGIAARHVDAKTPRAERDAAVAALESGKISVLSNVEVFTEGFDLPAIDTVILLRPTQSTSLYYQMVGRGLRKLEGGAKTVLLDHSGLVYQHGMPDASVEWSLDGDFKYEPPPLNSSSSIRVCPACSAVHRRAAICPECGHQYEGPARTVDQISGALEEVVRGDHPMPNGYESQMDFATRVGCSYSVISKIARYMRNIHGAVHIETGLAYYAAREKKRRGTPPDGYETAETFAERVGKSDNEIKGMINSNMVPTDERGHVHVAGALEQMKTFESPRDFDKRIGIPDGDTDLVIGLNRRYPENFTTKIPVKGSFVLIPEAIEWFDANYPRPRLRTRLGDAYVLMSDFVITNKIDNYIRIDHLIKVGNLPYRKESGCNYIHKTDVSKWLAAYNFRPGFRAGQQK